MEITAGLIKLKANAAQSVDDWQKRLSSSMDEVISSLKNEGVEIESWFRITIDDNNYLLWYMRAESVERAVNIFQNSTAAIDKFHLETLKRIAEPDGHFLAEPLLDFLALK